MPEGIYYKSKCYFRCNYDGPLHRFPKANCYKTKPIQDERYKQWICLLDKETITKGENYITKNMFICSRHFEDCFKLPSGRLTKNAIPTLNITPRNISVVQSNEDGDICNEPTDAEVSSDATVHANVDDTAEFTQPSLNDTAVSDADNLILCEGLTGEDESLYPDAQIYSWQEPDDVLQIEEDELDCIPDNLFLYCDNGESRTLLKETKSEDNTMIHAEFRCNECNGAITGFRYTCVQCSDLDLCGACEAARAHHHHYVLRIPAPKPIAEVQLVLATIRRHLMRKLDPIIQHDQDLDDLVSIKSEVKSESDDQNDDWEDEEPKDNTPVDEAMDDFKVPVSTEVTELEVEVRSENTNIKDETENNSRVKQYKGKTSGAKLPPNKKIIIKRANIIDPKDVETLAKKIRLLPMPNKKLEVEVESMKSQIKESVFQHRIKIARALSKVKDTGLLSRTETVSDSQQFKSDAVLPIKRIARDSSKTKVISKLSKNIGDVLPIIRIAGDLRKEADVADFVKSKVAGNLQRLKVIGHLPKNKFTGDLSKIKVARKLVKITDVNNVPKIQLAHKLRRVNVLDVPHRINVAGAQLLTKVKEFPPKTGEAMKLRTNVGVKPKPIVISRNSQVENATSQSNVADVQPGNKVKGLKLRTKEVVTQPLARVEAAQAKANVPRMLRQVIVADGLPQKEASRVQDEFILPDVQFDTSGCSVRLQRLPPDVFENAALNLQKSYTPSDLSSNPTRVYSYNTYRVASDCTVRLSRLPDAVKNVGQRLSSQTRAPSVDSRDSSDEDNR